MDPGKKAIATRVVPVAIAFPGSASSTQGGLETMRSIFRSASRSGSARSTAYHAQTEFPSFSTISANRLRQVSSSERSSPFAMPGGRGSPSVAAAHVFGEGRAFHESRGNAHLPARGVVRREASSARPNNRGPRASVRRESPRYTRKAAAPFARFRPRRGGCPCRSSAARRAAGRAPTGGGAS